MAIPASYTEVGLADYMHAVLGAVATTLGWTVDGGDYDEAVDEAIAAYGVDDITDVAGRANIRKLRALARREVWRAVMAATASHYDVNVDGASRQRSQIHAQARAMFAVADAECAGYEETYEVGVETVSYTDPYRAPEDEG